tara:strand:- start:11 stop:190 length:180 start_codon:yes stop_codon:yes gene_type:complete
MDDKNFSLAIIGGAGHIGLPLSLAFADIRLSVKKLGYKPRITIQTGVPRFLKWYNNYEI